MRTRGGWANRAADHQTDIAALTGDLASLSGAVDSQELNAIEGSPTYQLVIGSDHRHRRGSDRIGEINKRVEVSNSKTADGTRR
jgi:hypothetical protein